MPAPLPTRLEDLPNIGKSIANDLRGLGILTPQALARRSPLKVYLELGAAMAQRHDPCVFYTLLSVQHFFKSGERVAWWKFTEEGRRMLGR